MSGDGLTNAVLIAWRDGYRWVTDPSSISTWGRIESFLSVGDVSDLSVVDAIGAEYLSARSQPRTSHVAEVEPTTGDVPGVNVDLGDTATVAGETLECVGLTYSWGTDNEDGLRKVPEFATRLDARLAESERAVERLIVAGGGRSAISAPPVDRGTDVATGKVRTVSVPPWSWNASEDLDDTSDWQPWTAEEPVRLTGWSVRCDASEADGTSTFRWRAYGAANNGLVTISLTSSQDYAFVPLYGYSVLVKGATLAPFVEANGGHKNGAVQFYGAEVV
jgi:hypothetical protein